MNILIDNEITAAIDAQLIIAPQYGVIGPAPLMNPPSGPNGNQKTSFRRTESSGAFNVQNVRTKDLKLSRAILIEEVKRVTSGQLEVTDQVATAMMNRLEIMNQEMVRRDHRDYSARKLTRLSTQGKQTARFLHKVAA